MPHGSNTLHHTAPTVTQFLRLLAPYALHRDASATYTHYLHALLLTPRWVGLFSAQACGERRVREQNAAHSRSRRRQLLYVRYD